MAIKRWQKLGAPASQAGAAIANPAESIKLLGKKFRSL